VAERLATGNDGSGIIAAVGRHVAGEVVIEAAGWTTDGEDAAFATTIAEGIRGGTWDSPRKASTMSVKDGTVLIDVVEVTGKCDGG